MLLFGGHHFWCQAAPFPLSETNPTDSGAKPGCNGAKHPKDVILPVDASWLGSGYTRFRSTTPRILPSITKTCWFSGRNQQRWVCPFGGDGGAPKMILAFLLLLRFQNHKNACQPGHSTPSFNEHIIQVREGVKHLQALLHLRFGTPSAPLRGAV